jgi:hypothetical protein
MAVIMNPFTRLLNFHFQSVISMLCNRSCEKRCFWDAFSAAALKKTEETASLKIGIHHFWGCDVEDPFLFLVAAFEKVGDQFLAVFA